MAPHSQRLQSLPEIDRDAWFAFPEATRKIVSWRMCEIRNAGLRDY